jgi:hypothetical protein
MKLKLDLKIRRGYLLPVNYQHEFSFWIFKTTRRTDRGRNLPLNEAVVLT